MCDPPRSSGTEAIELSQDRPNLPPQGVAVSPPQPHLLRGPLVPFAANVLNKITHKICTKCLTGTFVSDETDGFFLSQLYLFCRRCVKPSNTILAVQIQFTVWYNQRGFKKNTSYPMTFAKARSKVFNMINDNHLNG